MPIDLSADQVRTMQIVRFFQQVGGAAPLNTAYPLGTDDAQIGYITGGTIPQSGSIDPIWSPDPANPRQYVLRGRQRAAPGLPTWTVDYHEFHQALARQLKQQRCPITFYEVAGKCERLDDLNRGWNQLLIRANGIAQDTDTGARGGGADDTPLTDSVPFTGERVYPVGPLGFGDEAAAQVVQEVIDGVYLPAQTCGDCGLENDGSRVSYYVTRANVGSPSAPGQVVYSTDYGLTWNTDLIDSIGTTNAPDGIDTVSGYLFVWVRGSTAIFYTPINRDTAAPGAWTQVSGAGSIRDAWVNGRTVWFCGDAGLISRTRDITVAPTTIDTGAAAQLNRIHGRGQTIVAVGQSGVVRASQNGGITWTTVTVVTGTPNLNGVQVLSAKRWWVVTAAGTAFYTEDGGTTWTAKAFAGSGAGVCRDIVFVTQEVGYILHDASSTAWLVCTVDGGNTWSRDGARLMNWPVFERGNRAVVPTGGPDDVNVNTIGIAGLYGVGGDGVIQLGVAPVI
jgi:hypothetical protein